MKNRKRKIRKVVVGILLFLIAVFLICLFINLYIINFSKKYIYTNINDVPVRYTAIVPGASVFSNNTVSHVLRDRIVGAMDLIKDKRCTRFLVSGDHGTKEYDEVNASRKFVLKNYDVDEKIIFMDHAGFSTYETMYRARDVFCVNDCCIVTQKFHIYRSVFIARKLGLNAVGYVAPEISKFSKKLKTSWNLREFFARVKAFFDVLFKVKPTYLGKQILITGDGHETWK